MFVGVLLILYFILFLSLSIWRLKWAVLLVVGFCPSYLIRFDFLELPMTVLEGMILIVFLVWGIGSLKYLNKKIFKKFLNNLSKGDIFLYLSMLVFLLSATVAMFMGPDLRVGAGVWKAYFIEPILFLWVFVSVIKKEDLKKVFGIFLATVLVLGIVAIYQKITGDLIPNEFWAAEETRRVTGIYPYPNALALYLAPVVVILIGGLFIKISNFKFQALNILYKLLWVLVVIAGLVSVYFTKSKGAILGVIVGLIFYALFYRGVRKYFIGFLGIGLVVLVLYFNIYNPKINLEGNYTVEGGGSVTTRIEMWSETWEMIKTKPILGAGLGGYSQAVEPWHKRDYIEIYLYPHNIVLNFWSEIGLLGLISFMGILGWFYYRGFFLIRKKRNYNFETILMAGILVVLIHGLVDVPYFKNDLSVMFWIVVGGMMISSKKDRINSENKL